MLKKALLFATIIAGTLSLSGCGESEKYVATDGSQYQEGKHYSVLKEPILTMKKNEVLEFFWYGCPHCYSAEEAVKPWADANSGKYVLNQQHSQISDSWMFDAYVFYGLKSINKTDALNHEFFEARQTGKVNNQEEFISWLMKHNISKEDFDKASSTSDIINLRSRNSEIEKSIGSNGVPAFIVSGKYKVEITGLMSIGGWTGLTPLLEYLLEKDSVKSASVPEEQLKTE